MKLHQNVNNNRSKIRFITLEEDFHTANNNKYDYSKAVFINTVTPLEVICPIHGSFWPTPGNHLKGKGCIKCAGKAKLTTKEWVIKAAEHHGDLYDYSKVNYVNARTKVEIGCKIHGFFKLTPNAHLGHYKQGCPKCGINKQATSQRDTTSSFIEKAKIKHNNYYIYSKVDYISSSIGIIITCPIHGDFKQTPNTHLMSSGCSSCNKQGGFDRTKPAYFYTFRIEGIYKIGITNRTLQQRYNKTDFAKFTDVYVQYFKKGEDAYMLEKLIKQIMQEHKYKGPSPFTDTTGITECFTVGIKQFFSDNYSDIKSTIGSYPIMRSITSYFICPINNPVKLAHITNILME